MINATEKNKAKKEEYRECRVGMGKEIAFLCRAVRGGLMDEAMFEQRPKGSELAWLQWGVAVPSEGTQGTAEEPPETQMGWGRASEGETCPLSKVRSH